MAQVVLETRGKIGEGRKDFLKKGSLIFLSSRIWPVRIFLSKVFNANESFERASVGERGFHTDMFRCGAYPEMRVGYRKDGEKGEGWALPQWVGFVSTGYFSAWYDGVEGLFHEVRIGPCAHVSEAEICRPSG